MAFFNERRNLTVATLIVAFIFLFAFNAFVGNAARNVSADLTADKEFTLSAGTERVLKSLQEPIVLRLFLSPSLVERVPSYGAAADRVRNLLNRYVALSDGKIRLETYRPEPYSVDEDKAAAYGMEGVPIDASGEVVYFGLAGTNTVDAEEKIAFFHPTRQRFIEYDITRLVHSLGVKKKVVGLIAGLPINGTFSMQGGMQQPWPVMKEIEKLFEVETVDETRDSIPDDIDVLMIFHPQSLSDKTLYAIDQYVLKGGRALVMVDPVPLSAPRRRTFMGAGPVPPGSDLPKLLKAWGIAYDSAAVATDARRAIEMEFRQQGRIYKVPNIAYVQLSEPDLNAGDPVTARIKLLIFGIPGHLAKAEGGGTTVTPLATTTDVAMVRKAADYRQEPDLLDLYRTYAPGNRKLSLAVRVTGNAATAFPKGRPADPDAKKEDAKKKEAGENAEKDDGKAEAKPAHIAKTQKPLNLILVADADFLETGFWAQTSTVGEGAVYTPFANNADFVVNALDDLTGANPLAGLRGRGAPARPFTVVEDLRKASQDKLRAKQLELARELEGLQKKIADARSASEDGKTVLTEAQQETLAGYLTKFIAVRQEQRAVLASLRADVDALEARTKFFNIALIPLVIAVLAILVAIWRARRRRRRYETA
ncbi:MAG: GldG family protein [Rhodospirillaceae bacterium]|nr:GldG family protein [Rhodospirillaceae bacterium]